MKRMLVVLILLLASVPLTASAARSATSFRVGITIEHDCSVARTPDGADISLACDGSASADIRALAAGRAWPRATRREPGAPVLREVSESDEMRLIVVEY